MKAPHVPKSVWLSLAVLLALLSVPATRWIVRRQLSAALLKSVPMADELKTDPERAVAMAKANPDDFDLQLVAALDAGEKPMRYISECFGDQLDALTSDSRKRHIEALRALLERFPRRPEAHAAYLAALLSGEFHMPTEPYSSSQTGGILRNRGASEAHGDDDSITSVETTTVLVDSPAMPSVPKPPPPLSTAQVAEIVRATEAAEAVDPSNALYSLLRCIAWMSDGQPDRVRVELAVAAGKTTFDEYSSSEIRGRLKLHRTGLDGLSNVEADLLAKVVPNVLTDKIWQLSRSAFYEAWKLDKVGRHKEAVRWRQPMLHIATLMASQGKSEAAVSSGIMTAKAATSRLNGEPKSEEPTGTTQVREVRESREVEAYWKYVERHADEKQAADAGLKLEWIIGIQHSSTGLFERNSGNSRLLAAWTMGLALPATALVITFWGLLGVWSSRWRAAKSGSVLAARWALTLPLTVGCIGYVALFHMQVLQQMWNWARIRGIDGAWVVVLETVPQWLVVFIPLVCIAPVVFVLVRRKTRFREALPVAARTSWGPAASVCMVLYAGVVLCTSVMESNQMRHLDHRVSNFSDYLENGPGGRYAASPLRPLKPMEGSR